MNFLFKRGHKKGCSLICITGMIISLSGCATKEPPPLLRASDVELNSLAQQAKSLFEIQRSEQAIPLYRAALDRARALNDDVIIARLAYNLGASCLDSGDLAGAYSAFEESIHAAKSAGIPDDEAQLLLGHALLKQGKNDQALALCSKSIASQSRPDMLIRFQLLQADAYLQGGQTDRAEKALQEVNQQLVSTAAFGVQAQAAHIEGVIFSRRKQPSKAADAFLREARFWSQATRPIDVVSALVSTAEELKRAKDVEAEADCRYRIVRALQGQGRFNEALVQLEVLEAMPKYPPSLATLISLLRLEIDQHLSDYKKGSSRQGKPDVSGLEE